MNFNNVNFQYDGYGRRTGKTVSGATTNYLYDGVNVAQELAGTTVTANLLSGGIMKFSHAQAQTVRRISFRTQLAAQSP